MEKGLRTAVATAAAERYEGWQEVHVCGEKGMREIHYYLKKKDGGLDLAVVGKEKTFRHMSYRCHLESPSASIAKLRSRREVIDWLLNFLPDSSNPVSPQNNGGSVDADEGDEFGLEIMKGYQVQKLGQYTKEFLWVGSPSFCRKKRKHYEAFCRNGVKISVNEFVYVLAEEDKRLVAYLEDMYEDLKGNKMVVVRWFHKIDEVGIDLPHNFNDREIFFSLCLQDLSIECIDGSATVLSPDHYAKFLKGVKHTHVQPFMCHRQYDNDELKPLDITLVKGYWKQEIVKLMVSRSSKAAEMASLPNDSQKKGDISDTSGTKPRKRLRLLRDSKVNIQSAIADDMEIDDVFGPNNVVQPNQQRSDATKYGFAQGTASNVCRKDANTGAVPLFMGVGSSIEVLSQDSGMRGCWFGAVIIKKHKNKVKLRYSDIKDAENESNCLEEWVFASRIAARDEMGIRMCGRTAIRPTFTHDSNVSCVFNVGTNVDVWWHDGWWEGIVVHKESDKNFRVYFPGEKREAFFCQSDLRPSQEWIGNTWKQIDDRPDLAASILSELEATETTNVKPASLVSENKLPACVLVKDDFSHGASDHSRNLVVDSKQKKAGSSPICDLSKDDFLSQLRWKSSRKRKRIYVPRVELCGNNRTSPSRTKSHQDFVVPRTLNVEKEKCKSANKVDRDNCKYISDSLLTSSVVQPLTSLVMSR